MGFKETGCWDVECLIWHILRNKINWRAVMNKEMNFRLPQGGKRLCLLFQILLQPVNSGALQLNFQTFSSKCIENWMLFRQLAKVLQLSQEYTAFS